MIKDKVKVKILIKDYNLLNCKLLVLNKNNQVINSKTINNNCTIFFLPINNIYKLLILNKLNTIIYQTSFISIEQVIFVRLPIKNLNKKIILTDKFYYGLPIEKGVIYLCQNNIK